MIIDAKRKHDFFERLRLLNLEKWQVVDLLGNSFIFLELVGC